MSGRRHRVGRRARGPVAIAGLALLALFAAASLWIAGVQAGQPRRKVMQYRVATVLPSRPPERGEKREPEPAPRTGPEGRSPAPETRSTRRVEFTATDYAAARAPGPPPGPGGAGPAHGGGGGRLGLAGEAQGPGDAFDLVAKPAGRGILGGGRLGDGTRPDSDDFDDGSEGEGASGGGGGGATAAQRYAWYYAKLAADLETAFRSLAPLRTASTRVELRVWADRRGRISRVRLARSTGDKALDEAILSVQGLKLREPPPSDIPMPMVARLTARRPE